MNYQELAKAVKKAKKIFAFVKVADVGVNLEITKKQAMRLHPFIHMEKKIKAETAGDFLYIG